MSKEARRVSEPLELELQVCGWRLVEMGGVNRIWVSAITVLTAELTLRFLTMFSD